MSDLVERVARAIYEADDPWHKAWPWPDLQSDQAGVDQYRRIAGAALAAMQTDAAPALKPAVDVWREAADASNSPVPCEDADCKDCQAAAAVIEADRAAIIAAKDAEIVALKDAWQKQFDEKVKERNEAKLWFEKAQEWKQSLTALQAHADAMAGALETAKQCEASSFWGADAEKYARAARRGAFRKITKALRAYEEFRRG